MAGDSLLIGDRSVDLSLMGVQEVVQREGSYDILLRDVSAASSRRGRESANRYASFKELVLPEGEFVRGSVLVVGGVLK